jgi:hypothetical protein
MAKVILRNLAATVVLALGMTGCAIHHPVTFEKAAYTTGAQKHAASVVAVIDKSTLAKKVPIRSALTGYGNIWEVQPGDMLKQVTDIELPQMFDEYTFADTEQAPPGNGPGFTLSLSIPRYAFEDLHAKVSVQAVCKARNGETLFEKAYSSEGAMQAAKMAIGGAFGMKSAIRTSSLDAYKQIFAQMRDDLDKALANSKLTAK